MIVYEVDLTVQAGIAEDFRRWLPGHVARMLGLPGFLGADIYADATAAAPPGCAFAVRYRLQDAAALERYLREFAPAMRDEGLQRFGERFGAQRRVLHPLLDA